MAKAEAECSAKGRAKVTAMDPQRALCAVQADCALSEGLRQQAAERAVRPVVASSLHRGWEAFLPEHPLSELDYGLGLG
jgi:hypothetical protein